MILAKARIIGGANGKVRVGLSFPTGFDPEEVLADTIRGNGTPPLGTAVDPRRGSLDDIFREFEVSFDTGCLGGSSPEERRLQITGAFRRGIAFRATLEVPPERSSH